MICKRCQGLMVVDCFANEKEWARDPIWRCITCGEIVDRLILINRTLRNRSLPRRRRFKLVSLIRQKNI